jgi:radical SAM protein with 4Fe4S-binding SPASM domain
MKMGEKLTGEETAHSTVDWILGLRKLNLDVLDITGGEPFLREDLYHILHALPEKTKIGITTNASRLVVLHSLASTMTNERIISWTLSWHPSNRAQEMTFWKICERLKEKGFHVSVNHVLAPGQIVQAASYCRSQCGRIGVRYHADPYDVPPGAPAAVYTDEELSTINALVQDDRRVLPQKAVLCNAGLDHFIIVPNGDIYPCLAHMHANTTCIGNIANWSAAPKTSLIHCPDIRICAGCDRDSVKMTDIT